MKDNNIAEIEKRITKLRKSLRAEIRKALNESFKEFFENFPEVRNLTWTQFTPYFNDGDACYFSYNSIRYYPCTIEVDGEEIECDEPGSGHDWWKTDKGLNAMKVIKELDDLLENVQSELEYLFGDHMRVVATSNGFEADEEYHE